MDRFFQRFKISVRLFLLLCIAAIGTGLMVLFMLMSDRSFVMNEVQNKLDAINDVALTQVQGFYRQAESGNMTEQEAQAAALAMLANIKYDGGNYIYTLSTNGTLLQHPNQRLQGQKVLDQTDSRGTPYYRDMLSALSNNKEATVRYHQNDKAVLARVAAFEPWGWVINTRVEMQTINGLVMKQFWRLMLIALCLSIPLLLLFMLIIRSITKPLNTSIAAMQDIASGDGDLTVRLNAEGNDELSQLGHSFNLFVSKVQQVVKSLQESALQEEEAAEELTHLSHSSSSLSAQLASEASSVATAVHELSASAAEVADHARQAAESASEADKESHTTAEVMHSTVESIDALAIKLNSAVSQTKALEESSSRIGDILEVIVNIAEQTNLLALNAAIEAARAGEAGRGFAVVADEVRTLATRTQHSTNEISQLTDNIQAAISNVSTVINDVQQASAHTSTNVGNAENALRTINQAVETISSMNVQIATATDEQSRVTSEISQSIVGINDLTNQNEENNQALGRLSNTMSTSSHELAAQARQFKT
ncbi:methyl-accepting chemotaxis protein [Aliidiomarina taiwanensis]|uniref:Methyl-accepting chemotaxis protein n=1 Tax=Aliidiomarina taiwanensis TaxID=946228 RepID=A0A432X9X1_9GAMM|nr:methyl-accepting chemotaxis protein [Aliidiomarina taiwanensis]RUO44159.1 methyl-accepting chemotaxis protein [Aliidiomarina taiwanensis]